MGLICLLWSSEWDKQDWVLGEKLGEQSSCDALVVMLFDFITMHHQWLTFVLSPWSSESGFLLAEGLMINTFFALNDRVGIELGSGCDQAQT